MGREALSKLLMENKQRRSLSSETVSTSKAVPDYGDAAGLDVLDDLCCHSQTIERDLSKKIPKPKIGYVVIDRTNQADQVRLSTICRFHFISMLTIQLTDNLRGKLSGN